MIFEILEEILTITVTHMIPILEMIGVIIVTVGAAKSFYQYICSKFDTDNHDIKLGFAKTLAFALEFKMAGEILKTVITKTIDEMYVLAAIIVLRAILTFVIHWEIKFDTTNEVKNPPHA